MPNTRKQPVTLEDVSNAMRELIEEGAEPSVRTVRERIGRGSMTTISKFVEQARAGVGSAAGVVATFPAALESLCLQMVEAINSMASQTVAEERGNVEVMRKHVEEKAANAELQVTIAKQQLASEAKLTKELMNRIASLEDEVMKSDTKLAAISTENLNLKISINALEQLSSAAETESKRLAEYIKQYEVKSAELLTREKAEGGRRISLLETEVRSLRTELITANSENRQHAERYASLEIKLATVEGYLNASEQMRESLQALVSSHAVVENKLDTKVSKLEQQLEQAQSRADRLTEKADTLTEELIRRQAREELRDSTQVSGNNKAR